MNPSTTKYNSNFKVDLNRELGFDGRVVRADVYDCAEVCLWSVFESICDLCERDTFAKHKKHSKKVID